MSVCLFVCLCVRSHNSKTAQPNLAIFLCVSLLPMALAQSSSGSVEICYVLPVLWITSCFGTTGSMVEHLGFMVHILCISKQRECNSRSYSIDSIKILLTIRPACCTYMYAAFT